MLLESDISLLHTVYLRNYLLSKHCYLSILQTPVFGIFGKTSIIHISKDLYARLFFIWALIYKVDKFFTISYVDKIKIIKKRGAKKKKMKRAKLHSTIKPHIYIYSTLFTLKDLYKIGNIYTYIKFNADLFAKKHKLPLENVVKANETRLKYNINPTSPLTTTYRGVFDDELVLDIMESLDYGIMPETTITFRYNFSKSDIVKAKPMFIMENVKSLTKSMLSFLL